MSSSNDYNVIVLAIQADVPLEVLSDTVPALPKPLGFYETALMELRTEIADMPPPVTPMDDIVMFHKEDGRFPADSDIELSDAAGGTWNPGT